jgi:hypothetical protein
MKLREEILMKANRPPAPARAFVLAVLLLGVFAETQGMPVLYGTAYSGPGGAASLYSIDSTSGAATLIGATGFARVGAIDFNSAGVLYGVGTDALGRFALLTINTTTGAGTEVGPLSNGELFGAPDMSFRNADGALYLFHGERIYLVNTTSGAATGIGDSLAGTGLTAADILGNAMAFSPSDTLFSANQANLLTLNQATGVRLTTNPIFYPPPGVSGNVVRANAMDFDNGTGTLWASVVDGSAATSTGSGVNYLATINTSTGVVTRIGPTVTGLDGLAVLPSLTVPVPAAVWLFGSAVGLLGWARGKQNTARPTKQG